MSERNLVTKYRWWSVLALVAVAALTFPLYGDSVADFGQALADSGRADGGFLGVLEIAAAYAILPLVLALGAIAGLLTGLGKLILVFVAAGLLGAVFMLLRRRWSRRGAASQPPRRDPHSG
ncbi:hypothetical protein ACFWF7_28965 [Nocardia sp. NPDC060256]|uniref:hypothetical protein n=1 Tax=unclassified Nocardia TaxID=2637762 RepID=UPI0036517D13